MTTVQLGYKAFDPHELLCHFVAVEAGLYKNIDVELIDITFIEAKDLPQHYFQASCGAALASAVQGISQRVLLVATDKPMFWLYGSETLQSATELKGQKLVGFPAMTPPFQLTRMTLTKLGLNPDIDIHFLSGRDDMSRLGLLQSKQVAAAVLSSAMPPAMLTAKGFTTLAHLGEYIRVPTTGLAVDEAYLNKEQQLCRDWQDILKESLGIIQNDHELVAKVLQQTFNIPASICLATAQDYAKLFTLNGQTTAEIAQTAINGMAKSMNIDVVPQWDEIYRFAV